MSTKHSYSCNLCGQQISQSGNPLGRGVKFFGPSAHEIEWTTVLQAENHLCDNCVNALMAAFRRKAVSA